jgi:hypothetical protein
VHAEDGSKEPPSSEQASAFQYLLDHEKETQTAVVQAIFQAYPELADSADYNEDADEKLPLVLEAVDQLRGMIGISDVHVLNVAKDGLAYVGFGFGCVWESEHGLGVMTHRGRVVNVGDAYASFQIPRGAEQDAGENE